VRDARLLELARLGDEAAFADLVQRHRRLLLAHCRSIVGDSAAHDAVQQTLISAWRALGRGCEVRNAQAWLFTIAHRSALQLLRAQPEPAAELSVALPGAGSPHELLERRTQVRATLAAVADLPSDERDALLLTTVYGRSGRDVAGALGVSEPHVRQLVFRARARARETLAGARALVPVFFFLPRCVRGMRTAAAHVARGRRLATRLTRPRLGAAHLGGHWGAAALTVAVVAATPPIVAAVAHKASRPAARPAARTAAVRRPAVATERSVARSRVRARSAPLAPRREVSRGSRRGAQPSGERVALAATGAPAQPANGLASAPAKGASAVHTPAAGVTGAAAPPLRLATTPGGAVLHAVTAPVAQVVESLPSTLAGVSQVAAAPAGQAPALLGGVTGAVSETANKLTVPGALGLGR
jgi:RNA polymerase sigma factor CnrH